MRTVFAGRLCVEFYRAGWILGTAPHERRRETTTSCLVAPNTGRRWPRVCTFMPPLLAGKYLPREEVSEKENEPQHEEDGSG
jgi:hypothetical protein